MASRLLMNLNYIKWEKIIVNNTEYPPGSDRRLIDWVRYPKISSRCVTTKCSNLITRDTDVGAFCLPCYLKLPACDVPGCHHPAMEYVSDNWNNKKRRKSWMPQCRDHYYNAEDEKDYLDEQRYRLQRGSSHSNNETY